MLRASKSSCTRTWCPSWTSWIPKWYMEVTSSTTTSQGKGKEIRSINQKSMWHNHKDTNHQSTTPPALRRCLRDCWMKWTHASIWSKVRWGNWKKVMCLKRHRLITSKNKLSKTYSKWLPHLKIFWTCKTYTKWVRKYLRTCILCRYSLSHNCCLSWTKSFPASKSFLMTNQAQTWLNTSFKSLAKISFKPSKATSRWRIQIKTTVTLQKVK